MRHFVNYNGVFTDQETPLVSAANRGLRYGDGIFETMKLVQEEIHLSELHFERLFDGLRVLQFTIPEHFSASYLYDEILSLCKKNQIRSAARIRLNVFRKNGGLYDNIDHTPNFIIEASELTANPSELTDEGLKIGLYESGRKSCDLLSNLKSNNYLPYLMGALYAREKNLDDCLMLNSRERICESTIANVFWIRRHVIFTPPLSEGCVAGVMRRHLIRTLPKHGFSVNEQPLTFEELLESDEVFLTNAVSGVRWVEQFQNRKYSNTQIKSIFSIIS